MHVSVNVWVCEICVCKDVMCVLLQFLQVGRVFVYVRVVLCVTFVYNGQYECGCECQRGSVYWAQMNR